MPAPPLRAFVFGKAFRTQFIRPFRRSQKAPNSIASCKPATTVLSWILVEERKPIAPDMLPEIHKLAEAMQMREERLMWALHSTHGSRNRPW